MTHSKRVSMALLFPQPDFFFFKSSLLTIKCPSPLSKEVGLDNCMHQGYHHPHKA